MESKIENKSLGLELGKEVAMSHDKSVTVLGVVIAKKENFFIIDADIGDESRVAIIPTKEIKEFSILSMSTETRKARFAVQGWSALINQRVVIKYMIPETVRGTLLFETELGYCIEVTDRATNNKYKKIIIKQNLKGAKTFWGNEAILDEVDEL